MALKVEVLADKKTEDYYKELVKKVSQQFELAQKARAQGFDPQDFVECQPVTDLADRAERIVGPKGVAQRYRQVLKARKGQRMEALFQIVKEIIEQEWIEIPEPEKRVEQAIKTGLVLITEGVVVSPLDGLPKVLISKNYDNSRYVDVYFAGPIRAAGGSATVIPLILADYARHLMGLDRFKPTKEEVERYVEEIMIYQEDLARQYKLKEDEVRTIIEGCPVCINGVPTEEKEVSVHRNLERMPSNRLRGGMCLVVSEGVALKALKILQWAKYLCLDWSWLEKIIKVEKTTSKISELEPIKKYLEGLAAGRPLLAYPSRVGGFRLRYGRSRNSGCMAKAINPALMHLLDEFIAVGTHVRLERPGKAAQLFPCDSIEGPIVLLEDGEVKQINSVEEARAVKPRLKKILFLGDLLVTVGDFRKTAHPLAPSPYVEEWWTQELIQALKGKAKAGLKKIIQEKGLNLSFKEAKKIAQQFNLPLHPKFIDYYKTLNQEELAELVHWVKKARLKKEKREIIAACFPFKPEIKELLERIGLEHQLKENEIVIKGEKAQGLLEILGWQNPQAEELIEEDVLSALTRISGLKIRDKGGTFIGARMGRPEAAKEREMKGHPHVLFPVGWYGGSNRSINKAIQLAEQSGKNPEVEIALFKCLHCQRITEAPYCKPCQARTARMRFCPQCSRLEQKEKCSCGARTLEFNTRKLDLKELMQEAGESLHSRIPGTVKGVKGLTSDSKTPEALEKGILRAKNSVHVFRDGTSRFELLNAPLTHFKPSEINLSLKKIKELGYRLDVEGKPLKNEEQLIELFPQDIIVNEKASQWLLKMTKFIDELLEKFYSLPAYYKAETKEDLIGQLVIGLAPHTSAGIVGRIIGFTQSRLGWSHPYFFMAKRRNCLVGQTPILIENASKLKQVPIDFFDDGSAREEIPLKNIYTYTIDERGLLKKERVKALLKQAAPKNLLEIKTVFGRKLTATADHKLLSFDGKKIYEKEAKHFKKGEPLLALQKIKPKANLSQVNVLKHYLKKTTKEKRNLRVHQVKNVFKPLLEKQGYWQIAQELGYKKELGWHKAGKALYDAIYWDSLPLDLFELLMKKTHKKPSDFKKALIGYKKQKSQIPAVVPLNKELGELVGYFLADGCLRTTDNGKRKKYVYQLNLVSVEKEITARMEKNIIKLFNRKPSIKKKNGLDFITLSGRVYYDFFKEILGTGTTARNKKVPVQIFNSCKDCLQSTLASYIVGDDYIDKYNIKVSSVNKNLINGFGLLGNLLGLFPHFYSEKRIIKSGYIKEFYERKGMKKEIQSYGIRLYSLDLRKIAEGLFGTKKIKFEQIKKTHQFRKKRIKKIGNFALDQIKEIKQIKNNQPFVYDLIVEGRKNYIAGLGQLAVFDCDGDQDSIMLLMDALLNFSQAYLSNKSGGRMDTPLVFTLALNPGEIDDEVYEMEACKTYPLEFFEASQNFSPPYIESLPTVSKKLGSKEQYTGINFSHETQCFDAGPKQSMYTQLKTMEEKIRRQAKLQEKIKAVDAKDALERVLRSHFFPDIIGNAHAFSRQKFRCTKCNSKYRRTPLKGVCLKCGNKLILTIAEGSVRKYLGIAKQIIEEHGLSDYLRQRIELTEKEVNSVFKNDKVSQKSLFEFA